MARRFIVLFLMLLFIAWPGTGFTQTPTTLQDNATTSANGNGLTIGTANTAIINVGASGTFNGTITFQATMSPNLTPVDISCVDLGSGSLTTTATTSGAFQCPVTGLQTLTAPLSGISAGSVTVIGRLSQQVVVLSTNSGGSGSGAPTNAAYWTGAANGSLTAEKNLGALSTGLVLNTAGNPTAYAGTTPCTSGDFISALNGSGVATCGTPSGGPGGTSICDQTFSSTDSQATIQAYLDAQTSPKRVCFNPGTYTFTGTVGLRVGTGSTTALSTVYGIELYGLGGLNPTVSYEPTSGAANGSQLQFAPSVVFDCTGLTNTAGNACVRFQGKQEGGGMYNIGMLGDPTKANVDGLQVITTYFAHFRHISLHDFGRDSLLLDALASCTSGCSATHTLFEMTHSTFDGFYIRLPWTATGANGVRLGRSAGAAVSLNNLRDFQVDSHGAGASCVRLQFANQNSFENWECTTDKNDYVIVGFDYGGATTDLPSHNTFKDWSVSLTPSVTTTWATLFPVTGTPSATANANQFIGLRNEFGTMPANLIAQACPGKITNLIFLNCEMENTFSLRNSVTTGTIAADQDDYYTAGLGNASYLRIVGDATPRTFTGISNGPSASVAGTAQRLLYIQNAGSGLIILKDASTASAAANRFSFGRDIVLGKRQGVLLFYDSSTVPRWRLQGSTQSAVLILEQYRLTAVTGNPNPTTDTSATTSVFVTPYRGNILTYFDDSVNWVQHHFSEQTVALGTTVANTNYSVWCWWTGTDHECFRGAAWTNDTTESEASSLQDGVLVNTNAIATHCGAKACILAGVIRATTTTQTADTAAKRFVCSVHNRVQRNLFIEETTSSWTYTGTADWGQVNGSATNQVEAVICEGGMPVHLEAALSAASGTANQGCSTGIGLDSTTAIAAKNKNGLQLAATASETVALDADYDDNLVLGYHKFVWLQSNSNAASTCTYFGTNSTRRRSAMGGWVMN